MLDSAIYTTPLNFSQFQPKLYRGTYPQTNNYPFLKLLQLKTIISILPEPITEESNPEFIEFIKSNNIELIHIPCDGKKKKDKHKKDKKKDKDGTKDTSKEKTKDKSNEIESLEKIGKDTTISQTLPKKDPIESTTTKDTEQVKQDKKKDLGEEEKKVKRRDKAVPITEQSICDIIDVVLDKENYPIYLHCSTGETITPIVVACLRKLSFWSSVSIVDEFIRYAGSINVHERAFVEDFSLNGFSPKVKDKSRHVAWIKRTHGWNMKS